MLHRVLLILFIGFTFSLNVSAAPVSYKCSYSKYSDERGKHNYSEAFKVEYVLDKDKNVAYVIGNLGINEVKFVEGDKIVTFIETTLSGSVMVTSITSNGVSVHSRHSKGIPSQSYGMCVI